MLLPAFIAPITDLSAAAPTLWVLIKATAILLVGLTLAVAMHRSSASTRYVVWLLSLAGLLALPAIATLSPVDVRILPAAPAQLVVNGTGALGSGQPPTENTTAAADAQSTGPAAQDVPGNSVPRTIPLGTLLLAVWGVVAVALLGRLLVGVLSVRRIVRRATPLSAPEWQELLYEIADRLGIAEAPALLKSHDISMPFAAGVRKATIVLPAECVDWSAAQRDAVLIHELGHVRRHDMIGHTLGRVACAVYWFHPLVWTASRRLRDASERACDDLAIRLGARPSEYAQHLLDIVTSVRQTNTPTAAIAMARRKEFEGRMLAILDPALRRDSASRWRTAMLSGALAVFVFAVSAAAPAQRQATPVTPTDVAQNPPVTPTTPGTTADPNPTTKPVAATDVAEAVEGQLPVANQALNAAAPILDKFIQDQARKVNVNVNTLVNGGDVDPEKRDLLIRILRTDSAASVRRVAAWGLQGYAADGTAQSALANAARSDDDASVRKMSVWALSHSSAPAALEALRAAVTRDRDEDVREVALWGLGTNGEAADAELIASRLASESSGLVRGTAAWAIGTLGAPHAPRALIALLDDPHPRTRLQAAWALSQIGDSSALPAIQRALDVDQDEMTTRALIRALVRSGASTEAITGMMNSRNPEVRLMAIRSMTGGGLVTPWPWPWPRPIVFP
jgi:beta-lactamase regulating signal transducer with metallopeptidase domain/HEAT repeat protein